MADRAALAEVGRQLANAVRLEQRIIRKLSDDELLGIARDIARLAEIGAQQPPFGRLAEIGAKQVSAGRLGAAVAHGTPGERLKRVEAMQRHADQLHQSHPDWSWREIARHVGRLFNVSGRTVRGKCKNPKNAGNGAYASRPAAGEIESRPTPEENT